MLTVVRQCIITGNEKGEKEYIILLKEKKGQYILFKQKEQLAAQEQKPSVRPRIREPTPEQKYQKEENHCYKVLTDYFHLLT